MALSHSTSLAPTVRHVAVVALLATVLGRVLGPALHGSRHGLDAVIQWTDSLGAFATYLFAIVGAVVLLRHVGSLIQEQRLAAGVRIAATTVSMIIISLLLPAMLQTLPQAGRMLMAAAAMTAAVLGGREAARVPRTRALGMLLLAVAVGALFHVFAVWLFTYAGEQASYRLIGLSRGLSAASLICEAAGVLTALVWISTRSHPGLTWGARIAVVLAFALTLGASQGAREGAPFWQVLASRAMERIHALPDPPGPQALAYLIEAFAPMLAVIAMLRRHEMPGVCGGFALALLASPTADVPLCALGLAIAAMSAIAAAKDDKGMWTALLSKPRPSPR